MPAFDPTTSLFAGLSTVALQAALAQAQMAIIALQSGSKAEEVSYATPDGGAKTVKYTRTEMQNLTMLIKQLQAQLGIIDTPRRAISIAF